MPDSPIADASLEALAERVARSYRIVRKRAPEEVRRRVHQCLDEVYRVARGGAADVVARVALARELESLVAGLRGREAFAPHFYCEGRLAIVRVMEPVRIRETIDDRSVRAHLRRYEERIERSERRMRWFFERAGLEVDPPPARPSWEQPYAAFEEYHELIWGKVDRRPPAR